LAKKFDDVFSDFDMAHKCDRRADRQTDGRTDKSVVVYTTVKVDCALWPEQCHPKRGRAIPPGGYKQKF